MLVGTFFALDLSLRPYVLKIMVNKINTISPDVAINELFWPAFWYLFLSFAVSINFRIGDYVWLNLNHPLKQKIGNALMERMMHHSQSLFNNNFSGNLATKIKDVMSAVPDLVKTIIENFYGRLLSVFIATFTLYLVHPKFAVILFLWSFVFIAGATLISVKAKILSDDAAEKSSQMVGGFVDTLGNILSVRLFSASSFELNRVNQAIDVYVKAAKKRDWYLIGVFAFQGFSFVL
jgi:ATP-binding cassette subfamily B protein